MNQAQKGFYDYWVKNWEKENPISVEGNISYLFCYAYGLLELSLRDAVRHLRELSNIYSNEEYFSEYCQIWESDCYVLLGKYSKALDVYPTVSLGSRGVVDTEHILSLKLQINEPISGYDMVALNGPQVTEWGKAHLQSIVSYLDIRIKAYEKHHDLNVVEMWKEGSHKYLYGNPGTVYGFPVTWLRASDAAFNNFSD